MLSNATVRIVVVIIMLLAASKVPAADSADQVYDRIIENWRWTHYWFGKTGIDDVYSEGKKVTALIFWSDGHGQPIQGLCSADLFLCVAYSGVYLDPKARRVQIPADVTVRQAYASFVDSGFADPSHLLPEGGLSLTDFQSEEKVVVLPALVPPAPVVQHKTPAGAINEAERVKHLFTCSGSSDKKPRGACTGGLVFAYYGSADPYWFVLRSCSSACEFGGEAVEELTRTGLGWTNTAGGFINRPKAEVDRLKRQIEKAVMFRLQF